VSGGVKVQSAATAFVDASDTAPNKTAGITPVRDIKSGLMTLIDFLLLLLKFF
jgi:hypothetical protein